MWYKIQRLFELLFVFFIFTLYLVGEALFYILLILAIVFVGLMCFN